MNLPDELSPPATANASDVTVLEHTLEVVADRCPDISPLVYARFFERCPQARSLFRLVAADQPPHGCGQMLFEILSLLQDCAAGRSHVASYAQQIGQDHRSFGGHDPMYYAAFLDATIGVLAEQLGDDWTPAVAGAWTRQSRTLQQHLA